jgi:hypothetical protein
MAELYFSELILQKVDSRLGRSYFVLCLLDNCFVTRGSFDSAYDRFGTFEVTTFGLKSGQKRLDLWVR